MFNFTLSQNVSNIYDYADVEAAKFKSVMTDNNKSCLTDLCYAISLAEHVSEQEVLDCIELFFKENKKEPCKLAELINVLNFKSTEWYQRNDAATSKWYANLYLDFDNKVRALYKIDNNNTAEYIHELM